MLILEYYMSWDFYIKQFQNYMKLERSLAENSIQAYLHDVVKLKQFIEISNINTSPINITGNHLQDFLEYINELGMTPYSQARILSGIKAFYKYLVYEDIMDHDHTQLIEGPKLGRKLPDILSY